MTGTDVQHDEVGWQGSDGREPGELAAGAERQPTLYRIVRGGKQDEPGNRRRYQRRADGGRPAFVDVGLDTGGLEAEVRMQIRPALIEVDEHHALAELSEIDREIDRYQALADAAASAPDRDDPTLRAAVGIIAVGWIPSARMFAHANQLISSAAHACHRHRRRVHGKRYGRRRAQAWSRRASVGNVARRR